MPRCLIGQDGKGLEGQCVVLPHLHCLSADIQMFKSPGAIKGRKNFGSQPDNVPTVPFFIEKVYRLLFLPGQINH